MKSGAIVKILTSNDLKYDQRIQKVSASLSDAGYQVEWIGRILPRSEKLDERSYRQTRLNCFIHNGPFFYFFLNLRLFFYVLMRPVDLVYAVDLDTIAAAVLAARIKRAKVVYDAHEYFTEVPELEGRALVRSIWQGIGRLCVSRVDAAITVGEELSRVLSKKYQKEFNVIRNVPRDKGEIVREERPISSPAILLYQGVLNKGRGLEQMIDIMGYLDNVELWLIGEGDHSESLRERVRDHQLTEKVRFIGMIPPVELPQWTVRADIGLNLLEGSSLNYYYSLANKFLDYIQAGVPSVNMDFPEYRRINERFEVGVLISSLEEEELVQSIREILDSPQRYQRMRDQCLEAREELKWSVEEKRLLQMFDQL